MKICPRCNSKVSGDALFCEECGYKFETSASKKINSKGTIPASIVIGIMAVALLIIAVAQNTSASNSAGKYEEVLANYSSLKKTVDDNSDKVSLSKGTEERLADLRDKVVKIDNYDTDETNSEIESLKKLVNDLSDCTKNINKYKKDFEKLKESAKKNNVSDECENYKENCKKGIASLEEAIEKNDADTMNSASKTVSEALKSYKSGIDQAKNNSKKSAGDAYETFKSSYDTVCNSAKSKKVDGNSDVKSKKSSAKKALEKYKDAIDDGKMDKLSDLKKKTKKAINEYQDVVEKAEAPVETRVVTKYVYLDNLQNADYSSEFIAYDSRYETLDVNAIASWLENCGLSDYYIACWFSLAANELSARYGATFSTPSLHDYFNYSTGWYRDCGYDSNEIRAAFTSVEKTNFDNFGRMRNYYCDRAGISTFATSFDASDFSYLVQNYRW